MIINFRPRNIVDVKWFPPIVDPIFYVRTILRMVSSVNEKKNECMAVSEDQQVETEVGHEVITSATNVPQQL